ncbi:hypothetical protein RRG08_052558 [Elysia crispata]|uniref:Uncharacterized protein n=1 Tax=Elysia crispata TaxID=231223 RepID=A0AAE0Z5D0_9GAST|nr:hypothetical protein RRG08_052558 [Elysia crispata]
MLFLELFSSNTTLSHGRGGVKLDLKTGKTPSPGWVSNHQVVQDGRHLPWPPLSHSGASRDSVCVCARAAPQKASIPTHNIALSNNSEEARTELSHCLLEDMQPNYTSADPATSADLSGN